MGSKLNRAWHEKHPMPSKATLEERAAWHLEHAEQCCCRPIPKSVSDYLGNKTSLAGKRPKSRV